MLVLVFVLVCTVTAGTAMANTKRARWTTLKGSWPDRRLPTETTKTARTMAEKGLLCYHMAVALFHVTWFTTCLEPRPGHFPLPTDV